MKGVQAAVLGGSALVLLILALRLTLKDHLPRRLFPALWCTAAIRFLLPVEIPTRLSVWNLLRGTAEPQTAPIASALLPFPQLSAAQTASAAGSGTDWRLLLWFGIAALLAAYLAAGYVCTTRRFHPRRILPQAERTRAGTAVRHVHVDPVFGLVGNGHALLICHIRFPPISF